MTGQGRRGKRDEKIKGEEEEERRMEEIRSWGKYGRRRKRKSGERREWIAECSG